MRRERGQALVEFALILPALILLLVGIAEAGWFMRNMMILDNNTREIARLAARGFDYVVDEWDEEESDVLIWANNLGLEEAQIAQYYVTIRINDGIAQVSDTRFYERGNTDFAYPDLQTYIDQHQGVYDMLMAEGEEQPKDMIMVFVKVVAEMRSLFLPLFGIDTLPVTSVAVFRVNILRGLVR